MTLPEALGRLLEAGRLPHAVLLQGAQPQALHDTALFIAKRLLCANPQGASPCGVCRVCTSFDAGSNPDLSVTSPDGAFVKVDQIRALRDAAMLSSLGRLGRVFVIESADLMTVQAQNALLKLLEEPPPGVTLLLTAAQPGALLPTVLSRVSLFRLEQEACAPKEALAQELVERLCEHDYYGLMKLQPALCARREDFVAHCDALCLVCHRLLCEKAGPSTAPLAARMPAALAAALPPIALACRDRAQKNASLSILGAAMLIECWEVLH